MKITLKREEPLNFETITAKRRDISCVGGREIVYCLLEIRSERSVKFAISAGEPGSAEIRILKYGEDAESLYRTVVSEGVAPCTLNDVLDDLTCQIY